VLQAFEDAFAFCESLERALAWAELQSERKRTEAATQTAEWDHLFEVMPAACVEVDGGGRILHANSAAAVLLNISSKHLTGRLLLHFTGDRERFGSFVQRLALQQEHPALSCTLRPRERAPLMVDWRAVRRSTEDLATLLVFITPTEERGPRKGAVRTATSSAVAMETLRNPDGFLEQDLIVAGDVNPSSVVDAPGRREASRRFTGRGVSEGIDRPDAAHGFWDERGYDDRRADPGTGKEC
jgi:PAS domain-containing protein